MPRTRSQPVSPLPHVAVAATYGLLLLTVVSPWTDPVSGVAVGALLVTALVVARQVITVRENVRLLADTAARQNEARFRSLVQHSSDVIMVTRPNGTMRFVSPSASRVFGYEPSALLGRPLATLLHPADRDRATQLFADVVAGPGVIGPVEWRFRQADGSTTRRHSGLAADGSLSLFGSSEPFPPGTLERLHPDHAAYARALEAATEQAVAAGVLLKEDASA